MSPLNDDNIKRLCIQYKAVFDETLPENLCGNTRLINLIIDYGILGYDNKTSFKFAHSHIRTQNYNKLLTDEMILSMCQLTYRN